MMANCAVFEITEYTNIQMNTLYELLQEYLVRFWVYNKPHSLHTKRTNKQTNKQTNRQTNKQKRGYKWVRNVRFSENLAYFVFLKHPFRDTPFGLSIDE